MRIGENYVRSRLVENIRRSTELSAVSLKLEQMAMELNLLRRLNGTIELLGNRYSVLDTKLDQVLFLCRSEDNSAKTLT